MTFASWVDAAGLSEAEERGAFDNLPGAGKPISRRGWDRRLAGRDYLRREGAWSGPDDLAGHQYH